jgi:alpha-maltose-1-phosphate synthase
MKKPTVAIVRGKFLNKYEMQLYEPLMRSYTLTAFGSLTPFHDHFVFPVVKLPSPMDIPNFPYKMPIVNRLFSDAHVLLGLEEKLRGFDLVHTAETYFYFTRQCLAAKRKGYVKKVIATVYENIPFNNEGIWGRKELKAQARNELDHIIAISQKAKIALMKEGADPRKISVIGHYIDTNLFSPTSQAVKRRADKNRKEITILFVGRLEITKGVYELIRAARLLLSDPALSTYHLTFALVGDGTQKKQLLALERSLGIEESISHRYVSYEEMPRMYQIADIFVAPSIPILTFEEQYCIALLEAQSCGLPIVTTKTGSIPENIGSAGFLVRPKDSIELASAIKRFIRSPQLRLSYAKKARLRAVTVHDIVLGAKKLARLYDEVLS